MHESTTKRHMNLVRQIIGKRNEKWIKASLWWGNKTSELRIETTVYKVIKQIVLCNE